MNVASKSLNALDAEKVVRLLNSPATQQMLADIEAEHAQAQTKARLDRLDEHDEIKRRIKAEKVIAAAALERQQKVVAELRARLLAEERVLQNAACESNHQSFAVDRALLRLRDSLRPLGGDAIDQTQHALAQIESALLDEQTDRALAAREARHALEEMRYSRDVTPAAITAACAKAMELVESAGATVPARNPKIKPFLALTAP